MRLGAPVVLPDRLQLRRLAVFAQWRDEEALTRFLERDRLGQELDRGWHVRLEFVRRWSHIAALPGLPARAGTWDQDEPIVAVTLARMRIPELPRFLRHGRPVERLVRDHPGVTLAVAGLRPPRTISTFSVWHSVRQIVEMVPAARTCPTRRGTLMRCASVSAATSTTSLRPTASGPSRSTAPGRAARASSRPRELTEPRPPSGRRPQRLEVDVPVTKSAVQVEEFPDEVELVVTVHLQHGPPGPVGVDAPRVRSEGMGRERDTNLRRWRTRRRPGVRGASTFHQGARSAPQA